MTPVFTILHAATAQKLSAQPATAVAAQQVHAPAFATPATIPDLMAQEPGSEHRVAKRHRVLKAAKIVLDDWRSIDCQIRDISETGAKIKVDGASALPHKFQLLIIVENSIRPVQIAWKLNDTIGVAFRGEATRAPIRKLVTGMC